jgi:hypothetical protein
VTALSTDDVVAQYRQDPRSVFVAPTNDWYRQALGGQEVFARGPRQAVGVPRLTFEGKVPVAVRAGGYVVVDPDQWPANLRSQIGMPAPVGASTMPSVPPARPPAAPAPRGARRSTPVSRDEVIARYKRDPGSVLFHPQSRAFRATLVLEGFEGDQWPLAVRAGRFVVVDVESLPADLRAALGLGGKSR